MTHSLLSEAQGELSHAVQCISRAAEHPNELMRKLLLSSATIGIECAQIALRGASEVERGCDVPNVANDELEWDGVTP